MARKIRADGDVWRAQLSAHPPRAGVQAVVFFCVTTGQRPYRVVEVPSERVAGLEDLEALSEADLGDLFRQSRSLGSPRTYA
ncbi:MAG: hypothetical protein Q8W51_04010 [Candidatus Palauibacterales bacterium]|nr:hypothetical protein [Candidatus Palauibacterales bacterium]MDP2528876.1 hypothetical protein [Candidatus Palauibacterales bacterium]